MDRKFNDNHKTSISQLVGFVKDSYLDRTSRPIYALWYLLFFIVIYEVGTIAFNPEILSRSLTDARVVVSFVWGQNILKFLGFSERMTWIATPLTIVVILLALQMTSGTSWRVRIRDFGPMSLECILLAIPLIVLSLAVNRSVNYDQQEAFASYRGVERTEAVYLVINNASEGQVDFAEATEQRANPLGVDIVTGIGAGIYEEFVFRLILICLLMLVFQDMLGMSWQWAVFISVMIAAILFSVHHHIFFVNGHFQVGEPFVFSKFIFRTLAGVYFAIVFAVRGFGITAGSHAFYNIIAAVLNTYVLS
jgi:CAAX prenyl protease-like protein